MDIPVIIPVVVIQVVTQVHIQAVTQVHIQAVTQAPIQADTQAVITVNIAVEEVVFTITAIIVLQGTGVTAAHIQVVGSV